MSDVLTPEEVSALLAGVSSGDVASGGGFGVATGDVRPLDLTNPDWINRDQVPPLDFINQVLARNLMASIRPLLKNQATVNADAPRLACYSDYLAELERPTSMHLTSAAPLEADVLFVLHADLILNYVDFYYGGEGVRGDKAALTRDFTVTEVGVANRFQKKAARFMTEAWQPILAFEFEDLGWESNPEFSNFFNKADVMTISRFNVALNDQPIGWMDVLIPKSALEPYQRSIAASSQGDQLQKQSRWSTAFERQVRNTDVELSTVLSTTSVNLGELVKLRIGDILPFDLPDTVELTAGDIPLFRGTFGVSNGHNAIRIVERLEGQS